MLQAVNPIMPENIGGSADLTGSNNTKTADLGVFDVNNRGGRYVYWGIREHGMAAAMNGMVLHGGLGLMEAHLCVLPTMHGQQCG